MAKKSCIYGPDLNDHEQEAGRIAAVGLRCMVGDRATDKPDKSDGPDTSKNGLEAVKGD